MKQLGDILVQTGIISNNTLKRALEVQKKQKIRLGEALEKMGVLSQEELWKWKLENYPQRSYDISGIFPEECDPMIIAGTIRNLKDVVDAEVIDTYSGSQIPTGNMGVTIRYSVIEDDSSDVVEKLLKGFGIQIR